MKPSCGMIFIFLLVRLQWNKSNSESIKVNKTSNGNSSVTDYSQSTVQPTSQRFFILPMTTTTNPSTVSHAAPVTTTTKANVVRTEMSSWQNSTPLNSTDGTTLSSNVITVSKDGITNSTTNFNRSPTSLAMFTKMADSSGATQSAVATSASTVTPSNSRVTYSTSSAVALPSENSSLNLTTLFPTSITLTSPTVMQDSPMPNLNPIQQTTELNHNFSNPSTASSNSKDANADKNYTERIIVGVIAGAILVSILIGLIGYFIYGKKRSESFSHRRLYDDTRNDPVLHLDNPLGPYDPSFACTSDDKTSTADKAEEDNAGCPSDGIPMADMTPSHSSS